jgi:hypothetical protein
MGAVRTIKNQDGKPYISLEDLIIEIEDVKNSDLVSENSYPNKTYSIDLVLNALKEMEEEFYNKSLFYKDD